MEYEFRPTIISGDLYWNVYSREKVERSRWSLLPPVGWKYIGLVKDGVQLENAKKGLVENKTFRMES
jgi:hypothetical protein